jgi:hypothetical protein
LRWIKTESALRCVRVEALLDRSSPLAWLAAGVLFVSRAAAVWIGVRDGFVRRRVAASSGVMTGWRAIATGAVYVATGLAGVVGGIWFAVGPR